MRRLWLVPLLLALGAIFLVLADRAPWGASRAHAPAAAPPAGEATATGGGAPAPGPAALGGAAPERRAAPPASEEPAEDAAPPAPAAAPAEGGSVRVLVRRRGGAPVAGARIEVGLGSGSPRSGSTDAEGSLELVLPAGDVPLYVAARAQGLAFYRAASSDGERAAYEESGELSWTIELRPAARIDLRVLDDAGIARSDHEVLLHFAGTRTEDGTPAGERPPGAADVTLFTGADGRIRVDDVDEGVWEAWCPPWRECGHSERRLIETRVGLPGSCVLAVVRADPSRYADGTLELLGAPRVEEGLVTSVSLRVDGRNSGLLLYAPGDFYVFGEPGERLEAHLLQRAGGAESAPFEIRIGQHGVRLRPSWSVGR